MSASDIERMEIHILNKLYRHTNIGEDYIFIFNILQGLEPHERDKKKAIRAIKNLIKKGLVELHKNSKCISLHRKNVDVVEDILKKFNDI